MNKNIYLIGAIILAIILIVLIINNFNNKPDEIENFTESNNDEFDRYISKNNEKIMIKLKWINPENKMAYYLGAIPKEKIDANCGAFDYVNKNEFTVGSDGINRGANIKPEYMLLLVNQYYIQPESCKNKHTCISSKFDESYFNFALKEVIFDTEFITKEKTYQLVYTPENKNESHLITYAKNIDLFDNVGKITHFGKYINYLSLVKQTPETTQPIYSKIAKSMNAFNLEKSYNENGRFDGFKMKFDTLPIYSHDNQEIVATTQKYVGISLLEPPCENNTCILTTCDKNDKKCIHCCSLDHKYLTLYDKIFNKKDKTKTSVVTFMPELADYFELRYIDSISDCSYNSNLAVEINSEECEPNFE